MKSSDGILHSVFMFSDISDDACILRVVFVIVWTVSFDLFGLIFLEILLFNLESINFFVDLNDELSNFSFCVSINEFIIKILFTFITLKVFKLFNNSIQSFIKLRQIIKPLPNRKWNSTIMKLLL